MAFVIAAPASSNGKTLLSLLLCSWAIKKGKSLQAFKVGPDYLDPQLLSSVTKLPCRNLDPVLCGQEWVINNFNHFASSTDFSLVEGVMGLFDGIGSSTKGSTAEIAKLLNLQVVLVVKANGQAGSIAALIKGFKDFDPKLNISGVVLNNVNSNRHKELLTEALSKISIKVLGCIPQNDNLIIENEDLGLKPAHEITNFNSLIDIWSSLAEKYLQVNYFEELLKKPNKLEYPKSMLIKKENKLLSKEKIEIAIAQDKIFHFRYPETKECLKEIGFNLIDWKLSDDKAIPSKAKLLIIPGGFPEQFAEEISQCKRSLNSIRDFSKKNLIYAECGGMLILGKLLTDKNGLEFPMANLLPFTAKQGKLKVGYRDIKCISDGLISKKGDILTGHEFHKWEIKPLTKNNIDTQFLKHNKELYYPWETKGWGVESTEEGWCNKYLHASWIHLHWPSSPSILKNITNKLNS
ncbi:MULTISPECIES: cobyrinate a,c-diamide synthase [unclassified Prochlorococcus]|uniref:cobyrinate a,c-diamide synthase n=1 Tax=unclassified Prochlorococcus TaxID=2627481 RepID=UPI00053396C6|nr:MULTISPECIES: cobyrinate a,c-diamide synthase [unclassified Prochlorococcus]KGG15452.1 Cobyrinic acid A [Prochlorococcus sp. MIT 0602]KGG17731.1 Cobyrinic acid A [Prochlorococcus sp. MIT 0603]